MPVDNVISAPDVGTIYEVPICYHERGLDRQLTRHFRLEDERSVGNGLDLSRWDQIVVMTPGRSLGPDRRSDREAVI